MTGQATIALTLHPAVYAAAVDEHVVLLNTGADAYLCLPGGDLELRPDGVTLLCRSPETAADLQQAGLLGPHADARKPRRCAPRVRCSFLRAQYPHPSLLDARDGASALLDLARHYRGRTFEQILETAREGPRARNAGFRPDLAELVLRFHAWIPFAPVTGKCLLRSFMLLRLLHRHGHEATWVFGVTTWPFEAHCWLQVEDMVLDDEMDRVAAYTPILVL